MNSAKENFAAQGRSRVLVVIPARYASLRLPGKVLAPIAGKSMVEHVWRRAIEAGLGRVVVATDSEHVAEAVRSFGAEVAMTSRDHRSGTDRTAEVASICDEELILNLQADEPLIRPSSLAFAVAALRDAPEAHLSTLARPLRTERSLTDPSVVKVSIDGRGYAVDFFREPDDSARAAWEHIGIYCYRRLSLLFLAEQSPTGRELRRRLEQMRALDLGLRIRVALTDDPCVGVNTIEELETVRAIVEKETEAKGWSPPGPRDE
jgi:3-deoxy-manno-octulosonate cytidylyltransferase (CMP-KDO synthetase)